MTTYVNKVYGHELQLYVANATGVMHPYALISSDRSFTVAGSQVEDPQVDLDDQSKPAVMTRRPQNSDTTFTGTGMLHANTLVDATTWALEGEIRDCEIRFANAMTVAGKYILSQFEVSGPREEAIEASMTLVQAEKPTVS